MPGLFAGSTGPGYSPDPGCSTARGAEHLVEIDGEGMVGIVRVERDPGDVVDRGRVGIGGDGVIASGGGPGVTFFLGAQNGAYESFDGLETVVLLSDEMVDVSLGGNHFGYGSSSDSEALYFRTVDLVFARTTASTKAAGSKKDGK